MLSSEEFDAVFDGARREVFRLEALDRYSADNEAPRIAAYLRGDDYDPAAEPREWYAYIRGQVSAGVVWRKVHWLRSPLSSYLRWELEWGYPGTSRAGQHAFVLDVTDTPDPVLPPAPEYDWWMFDEAVVVRMHYDGHGCFLGAERLPEHEVAAHVRYRDLLLAAAVPYETYWAAHPGEHRDSWLNTASPH